MKEALISQMDFSFQNFIFFKFKRAFYEMHKLNTRITTSSTKLYDVDKWKMLEKTWGKKFFPTCKEKPNKRL
jgi:hypothetical protein